MINSVDLEYGKAADLNLHGFIKKKHFSAFMGFFFSTLSSVLERLLECF